MLQLTIFTDGGSRGNPGPSAIGISVELAGQEQYAFAGYVGEGTNNEAEYQAILQSLTWLSEYVAKLEAGQTVNVTWKLDSKLVVEQLNKKWKIKEPRMRTYAQEIWQKLNELPVTYQIMHVPREQNKRADALVNQALDAR